MTNPERDKLIRETHTAVAVIAAAVGKHDKSIDSLEDASRDLEADMREVQTVQRDCPARAARKPSNVIAFASVILALAAFLFTVLRQPVSAEEPKPRHSQHRPAARTPAP